MASIQAFVLFVCCGFNTEAHTCTYIAETGNITLLRRNRGLECCGLTVGYHRRHETHSSIKVHTHKSDPIKSTVSTQMSLCHVKQLKTSLSKTTTQVMLMTVYNIVSADSTTDAIPSTCTGAKKSYSLLQP